jgi:hypothetical protein
LIFGFVAWSAPSAIVTGGMGAGGQIGKIVKGLGIRAFEIDWVI